MKSGQREITEAAASRDTLRIEVARLCPRVAPEVLDDFFDQLDEDYFALFSAAQIADHVRLVPVIDDKHPLQVRVTPRDDASADILLVGYDLVGEFALITGAMSACGLNIREGQVFSYKRGPERLTPWGGHTPRRLDRGPVYRRLRSRTAIRQRRPGGLQGLPDDADPVAAAGRTAAGARHPELPAH